MSVTSTHIYILTRTSCSKLPQVLLILSPLRYSVAYGVITGILVTTAIWIICFFLDVFSALVFHTKTMREVWLDTNSHFYIVFNMEQILIDELPGYKSQVGWIIAVYNWGLWAAIYFHHPPNVQHIYKRPFLDHNAPVVQMKATFPHFPLIAALWGGSWVGA